MPPLLKVALIFPMCLSLSGTKAIPVLWQFFDRWPSADVTRGADWVPISELLQPLGLHEKRAQMIIRFSGKHHKHVMFYLSIYLSTYGCFNPMLTIAPLMILPSLPVFG